MCCDWTYGLDSRAPWNDTTDACEYAYELAKHKAATCSEEWVDFILDKFDLYQLSNEEQESLFSSYAKDENVVSEFFEEYRDEFIERVAE